MSAVFCSHLSRVSNNILRQIKYKQEEKETEGTIHSLPLRAASPEVKMFTCPGEGGFCVGEKHCEVATREGMLGAMSVSTVLTVTSDR